MEAYGIIVSAFTLFGMLALVILSATMEDGARSTTSLQEPTEAASSARELKKAA
jgi:hypothetical protein